VPQDEGGPSSPLHSQPDQPTPRSSDDHTVPPDTATPEPAAAEPTPRESSASDDAPAERAAAERAAAPTPPAAEPPAETEPPPAKVGQAAPPVTPTEAPAEAPKLAAVGEVVDATVRRIAPFGAFVRLADGRKGLIHISQVADEFVEDVNEHLKIGQVVQARITAVADDGKVDLSIKKAKPRPKPKRPPRPKRRKGPDQARADAKPPKRSKEFHVNPLADVFVDVEKKLK